MTPEQIGILDYTAAVQITGLRADVQARLVEHIGRNNAAQPEREPSPLAVARCAAMLLAAAPERLSVPLALAQALTLARQPGLGPALMHLHEGLQELALLRVEDLTSLRLHAQVVTSSLRSLQGEIADLLTRIQALM
jgi:hypothetical protein